MASSVGWVRTRTVTTPTSYTTYGYWQGYSGRYPATGDTESYNTSYKDSYQADVDAFNSKQLSDLANQPKAIVNREFSTIETYAGAYLNIARGFMDTISTSIRELELPESDDPIEDVELATLTPMDYSSIPTFTPFAGTLTALAATGPVLGDLTAIPDIDDSNITVEDVTFTENQITVPNQTTYTAPIDIQTNTIDIPPQRDVTMPTAPTFKDLLFPDVPVVVDKGFDIVVPSMPDDLTEPANLSYTEGVYSSDIKVTLFAKVLNDIANGGTGLDVDVEQDIFDRGRSRQKVENERLYNETVNNFSGTGWELPTGVYCAAIAEIQKEISRKNDVLGWDISVLQAELEQKNIQFSVTQATQLEGMLMEFYNQHENRALDAAKATAAMGIQILEALIAKYNAKLKKTEVEGAVLGEWVKFEGVKADIYRTQMEGVKTAASVQDTKAGIYEKQLKAVETIKNMYAIDMESAKLQSQIERDKLEQLKIRTEIYLANLSGEKTKVDIYATMNDAEKTRAGIVSERVRANALRLESAKTKAGIQAQQAENTLKKNQQTLEKFKVELEQRRADIAEELKNAELNVKGFDISATSYNAQLRASEVAYSSRIKEFDNQIAASKIRLEKAVEQLKTITLGYTAIQELKQKGLDGVMGVAAQVGASALSALNVSASISDSVSRQTTETWTSEMAIGSTTA